MQQRRVLTPNEVLSFASPTKLHQALRNIGGLGAEGTVGNFIRTGVRLVRSGGQWALEGDSNSIKVTERHMAALLAGKKLHGSEPLVALTLN